MATFEVESLVIQDVHTSPKGIKTAALTTAQKRPLLYQAESAKAPFGPSNFEKDELAPRQNIELRVSQEDVDFFERLDEFIIQYLVVHSERIFKKPLLIEQVKDRYHGLLKYHEKHDPLLKCKINMPKSTNPCRYWAENGTRTDMPTDWRSTDLKPRLHLSHLWIMGQSCGIVANLTDVLVREESHAFPLAGNMSDE